MSHFVLDENNNKIEAYSAQEVISVLEQAIADGSLKNVVAGQAVIDKLKCCVGGNTHHVAFITQAKYNELEESGNIIADCVYFITDDTTADDCSALLAELNAKVEENFQRIKGTVQDLVSGYLVVGNATNAVHAERAAQATNADTAAILAGDNYLRVSVTSSTSVDTDFFELGGLYLVTFYSGSTEIFRDQSAVLLVSNAEYSYAEVDTECLVRYYHSTKKLTFTGSWNSEINGYMQHEVGEYIFQKIGSGLLIV